MSIICRNRFSGHLQAYNGFNTVVTYLTFSPDGRGLLANLGSEQVYLFDVTRKHVPKYYTIPSVLRKTKGKYSKFVYPRMFYSARN